jgi:hypothetical protein
MMKNQLSIKLHSQLGSWMKRVRNFGALWPQRTSVQMPHTCPTPNPMRTKETRGSWLLGTRKDAHFWCQTRNAVPRNMTPEKVLAKCKHLKKQKHCAPCLERRDFTSLVYSVDWVKGTSHRNSLGSGSGHENIQKWLDMSGRGCA